MKKKNLSKNFIIPLVVYPFDVMVSIAENDEQFKSSAKKVMQEEWYNELCEDPIITTMTDTQQGRTILLSSNQTIIRLKAKPEYPEEYGVLAHEIFHAVTFIFDRIGMKFKLLKNDEAYAYLIGYLTTEIYKRMYK